MKQVFLQYFGRQSQRLGEKLFAHYSDVSTDFLINSNSESFMMKSKLAARFMDSYIFYHASSSYIVICLQQKRHETMIMLVQTQFRFRMMIRWVSAPLQLTWNRLETVSFRWELKILKVKRGLQSVHQDYAIIFQSWGCKKIKILPKKYLGMKLLGAVSESFMLWNSRWGS